MADRRNGNEPSAACSVVDNHQDLQWDMIPDDIQIVDPQGFALRSVPTRIDRGAPDVLALVQNNEPPSLRRQSNKLQCYFLLRMPLAPIPRDLDCRILLETLILRLPRYLGSEA